MKIVIAGGGPAALESAVSARKVSAEAEIAIYSAENVLPYRRPALSGLLGAGKEIEAKTFYIKPESFFDEMRISFHGGTAAVGVEDKTLILADGEKIPFDRLILALGSEAWKPPIPGADGRNVHTLRSLEDMRSILAALEHGVKNAVIIGGGVLGLEIAESFISRKIETVVLENSPRLFAAKLSEADSQALCERLNAHEHLNIICGASAVKINDSSVELAGGKMLDADIVILSCGSRPDLSVAKSAALECEKGVIVNEYMQSSREDIFAAGDTAQFNGRCFNLYMDAVASGKAAGANAAGERNIFTAKFSPVRFFALGEKLVMP
ncbi:MAG: NAD(P)/FAD-dependent oxidoreductase [Lentisphaerae bacterium]|nr:NAD(P)/FAD-dependent oxidoreductase [Lentisphaerota bacterium]